jgi:hypothetical protein
MGEGMGASRISFQGAASFLTGEDRKFSYKLTSKPFILFLLIALDYLGEQNTLRKIIFILNLVYFLIF